MRFRCPACQAEKEVRQWNAPKCDCGAKMQRLTFAAALADTNYQKPTATEVTASGNGSSRS